MNEAFLSYIWRYVLFDVQQLRTTRQETIEIISVGQLNTTSGPDFQNAKIKVGDTTWVGHVEIHTHASHWILHNHQFDPVFQNVILHVVYYDDIDIENDIPVLELSGKVHGKYFRNFNQLMHAQSVIPCAQLIDSVPEITWLTWKERMVVERIERKTQEISSVLAKNKGDWSESFYQYVARCLGMKHNSLAMEWLAQSIPLRTLTKYKHSILQLEALLLGQAGFLEDANADIDYVKRLKTDYLFLAKKLKLAPMENSIFKTGGVRPPNQPTMRIAQLAQLIAQSHGLFRSIVEINEVKEIKNLFQIELHAFWNDRFTLKATSKKQVKLLGQSTIQSIIINAVVPFLFLYGKRQGDLGCVERALDLLRLVKAEMNSIVTDWRSVGLKPSSAFDTQSLIELKNEYCDQKKCLSCAIGHAVLKRK